MNTRAAIFSLSLMLSGAAITALPAHAQLFGESDEEKAARQAHEDGQDNQVNQLSGRVQQLEDRVRGLTQSLSNATGANEELAHQIQDLRQKIDAQQKDFAYRLCMVSAQQLGADGNEQGLNCGAVGAAPAGSMNPPPSNFAPGTALPPISGGDQGFNGQGFNGAPSSGAPQQLGRPPGTLGTLPMNSGPQNGGPANGAMNMPPRAAAPVGPSGASGGTAQYDRAMNYLAKAQYTEASAAFRGYADANPNDTDLSAQAIYWIGNIAYVQKNYPDATRAFAEQIKKYPDSIRSPDSMLKLGQALIAQGQTSGGCTTLGALKTKYPKAAPATLAAAAGARKAACR
ncbi:MAG: tol-pal system protein YbgF [Pseudomonadota bacterium]